MKALTDISSIERKIIAVRGQKVMLDGDLAELYGVTAKVLLQAVRRNIKRFPSDFMFQMEYQDVTALRAQTVTLKKARGRHRKYPTYVFTEQGVAMLSSVLRSEQAVEVNIQIMRAFVKLREMISSHKDLAHRLDEMEQKYDSQFKVVFDAIRLLIAKPEPKVKKIGFIKERRTPYRTTGPLPGDRNL